MTIRYSPDTGTTISLSKLNVPYAAPARQYLALRDEIDDAVARVLESGRYVNGPNTELFEAEIARYVGTKYAVAVGNGYDALYLTLLCLGRSGSRVGIPQYAHTSAAAALINAYGTPVALNEHGAAEESFNLQIAVHMNGLVTVPYRPFIEDAAQAIGSTTSDGRKAGSLGLVGCFSLHPLKTLGVAGDGGFVTTNDSQLAQRIRKLRNHGGGECAGVNSRLDEIQAAIALVKLPYLDRWLKRKQAIARRYTLAFTALPGIQTPADYDYHSNYVLRVKSGRDRLFEALRTRGVECMIHWPKSWDGTVTDINREVLSLPLFPELTEEEIAYVIESVKACG